VPRPARKLGLPIFMILFGLIALALEMLAWRDEGGGGVRIFWVVVACTVIVLGIVSLIFPGPTGASKRH
jgi:lipopolysaccharide export LptBFGC system permease protein LptF